MTRAEFQSLADEKLEDVKALIAAERWAAAYYHSGYVVEFGLKACIVGRIAVEPELIFGERRFQERCWSHDLGALRTQADLDGKFAVDCGGHPNLAGFWGIVKDWTELSRYEGKDRSAAEGIFEAITNEPDGVLPWIKTHW